MDEEQRRHLRAGMESVLNTVNTVFLATGTYVIVKVAKYMT